MLPYGKQTITSDDIDAVVDVLKSDWLTTGPMVDRLESEFSAAVDAAHSVAVSSGTAALHTAMIGAGIGSTIGEQTMDEVIVPAISFVATANAALYVDATPVFADVDPATLLIDPDDVLKKITPSTKAIVAVDYAGQPCDYQRLRTIADQHGLTLIADACHSLGAKYNGAPVGSLADFNCFSLHPVKPITCGESGLVTTHDPIAAERMREFRNHGITTDHRQRQSLAQHRYTMQTLGMNYRLTDIQCALAVSQLGKLNKFTERRREVAELYHHEFKAAGLGHQVQPLEPNSDNVHAYHLFVIRWNEKTTGLSRDQAFRQLRDRGIGVNVHYQPIFQQLYYQQLMPYCDHACPNAELVYEQILSLPIFPTITNGQVREVVRTIGNLIQQHSRLDSYSRAA